MTEPLEEREFEQLADDELNRLVEAVSQISDDIDPDLQMGVLSIQFEDGAKYVVNSHRAARQIWMAAERRAWHFDWQPEAKAWVAAQSEDELWSTLEGVLGRKLGLKVTLDRDAGF